MSIIGGLKGLNSITIKFIIKVIYITIKFIKIPIKISIRMSIRISTRGLKKTRRDIK